MSQDTHETDHVWAQRSVKALGDSLDVPDRRPFGERSIGYIPVTARPPRSRRPALIAVLLLVVALTGIGIVAVRGGGESRSVDTAGDHGQTSSTLNPDDQFTRDAANLTKPSFPPDVQKAIYQAQLAWSDCMHAHGIGTFPTPDPNFGDGKTPPMVVGGAAGSAAAKDQSGPAYDSAWAACVPQLDAVGRAGASLHPDLKPGG